MTAKSSGSTRIRDFNVAFAVLVALRFRLMRFEDLSFSVLILMGWTN